MTNQGQQVQLPERVTLQLTTQDAITILGALQDAGPFKVIAPIVNNVQAQLMAQQLKPQYQGPPPGAPGADKLADTADILDEAVADAPVEVVAHHPV